MTYVPLYGRVTDNKGGCAHSLCLRGKVTRIGFWLNSWLGEVASLSAEFIDGKEIVSRPDLRRIKKEDRSSVLADYEQEVAKKTQVILDLQIPANENFLISINGFPLSYERLKLMHEEQSMRFEKQIENLERLRDKQVLETRRLIMHEN